MADYTVKVDALFAHAIALGFTEQDFAELAVAAADQAGMSISDQRDLRRVLPLDECTTVVLYPSGPRRCERGSGHPGAHGPSASKDRK